MVRQTPNDALAHHLLGLAALLSGRLEAGVESLKRSVALDPTDPGAYANLGNGLRDLGHTDEALQAYSAALARAPAHVNALNDRATLFARLGRFNDALADYDRALAQNGRIAMLHNHRAMALCSLGRHTEALDSCAAALRLDPAYADAYLNRATVLAELCRDQEAIADYEACLALNPGRMEAVYHSGTAYLALGDYERGWARYEARTSLGGKWGIATEAGFAQPKWTGATSLAGKTILLHDEQGMGDALQFCRYANLAKAAGATVILQVEETLVRVLSTLKGADRVVAKGASLPDFDVQASIMSLPHAFGTTLQTVPAEVPYLSAEPEKVAAWERRLGPRTRPRIGLVWSGRVVPDRAEFVRRNVQLQMLAPLADAEADFVSLQKGEVAEAELAQATAIGWEGPPMFNAAPHLHDFSDTAALMQALDLVITVDTSTAHLAGALGRPVWILNRFDNCWRWLRERDDSPWYPTARLFRQKAFDDWSVVMREVAQALATRKPGLGFELN
jgi:tetratricopeptide (TPR) repeat protein